MLGLILFGCWVRGELSQSNFEGKVKTRKVEESQLRDLGAVIPWELIE